MKDVWLLFLGSGLFMAILGLVMFAYAIFNAVTIMLFLGGGLIIASVIQLANSCWARPWKGFSFSIILGMVYLITGLLLIEYRLQASMALTLVVAAGLMIAGSVKIILSIIEHWDGWILSLVSGVLTTILGFSIWLEWPFHGIWVIGCYLGVELILSGCTWIRLGASLHWLKSSNFQSTIS
ncbi:MAG: DUF308 domain-containing protein [Planctomycetia bacterium]|nr:DUF308 domain-containing protein [Planctomycetia bacterium]